jgi:predicted dehydrogenase
MAETFSACIIGCGIIGIGAVTRFSTDDRVRVTGVVDVDRKRADELALRAGAAAKAYTDVDLMLERERPDIVVLATPDAFHREPALAVARANVPFLFMQKPLATTMADAVVIQQALSDATTTTYMLFTNRFDYMDLATRYVIQQGLIGRPVYGEARLDDNIWVPLHLWGERSADWVAGSSPAQFLLSHVVDQVRWFLEPAEVASVFSFELREVLGNTSDLLDAFLFLNSGAKVRAKAEWIKFMEARVEFYLSFGGTAGSVTYNKLPGFGTTLGWRAEIDADLPWSDVLAHHALLQAHDIDSRVVVEEGWGPKGRTRKNVLAIAANGTRGSYRTLVDAVAERTDTPRAMGPFGALPGLADGLRSVEAVAAIHNSARERREVVLTTR